MTTNTPKLLSFHGSYPYGGASILYQRINSNEVKISFSMCSPDDLFDEDVGRKICEDRWNTWYLVLAVSTDHPDEIITELLKVLKFKRENRHHIITMRRNDINQFIRSIKASLLIGDYDIRDIFKNAGIDLLVGVK
jgi:hypothetical protein